MPNQRHVPRENATCSPRVTLPRSCRSGLPAVRPMPEGHMSRQVPPLPPPWTSAGFSAAEWALFAFRAGFSFLTQLRTLLQSEFSLGTFQLVWKESFWAPFYFWCCPFCPTWELGFCTWNNWHPQGQRAGRPVEWTKHSRGKGQHFRAYEPVFHTAVSSRDYGENTLGQEGVGCYGSNEQEIGWLALFT